MIQCMTILVQNIMHTQTDSIKNQIPIPIVIIFFSLKKKKKNFKNKFLLGTIINLIILKAYFSLLFIKAINPLVIHMIGIIRVF